MAPDCQDIQGYVMHDIVEIGREWDGGTQPVGEGVSQRNGSIVGVCSRGYDGRARLGVCSPAGLPLHKKALREGVVARVNDCWCTGKR